MQNSLFADMNNNAFVYFILSMGVFIIDIRLGALNLSGAWWGKPPLLRFWALFLIMTISFLFSVLAFFKGLGQVKNRRGNPTFNLVSLIGGALLGLFTGFLSISLARILHTLIAG